ncbi:MAG TPA: hypothetical protein VFO10_16605 [Oligoflexus sp.]|uniref:hypothetical protein n=1 Tax=Oligoflexus sp. TaxID=1971216 RepID=UPI002D8093B0|nr:hypothetical protein [Oligoflexus sp.]HET9238880.1 hypothetical protein [Oligoflexus sp.]
MKKTFDRNSVIGLIVGLLAAVGVASLTTDSHAVKSLAAGYVLFALNFLALKSISRTLVDVAAHGHSSARAKLWLTLGSMAKFLGLIGALFVLLVVLELSGFYVALGSLLSLIVLTGIQVVTYLRSLAAGTTAPPKS